MWTYLDSICNLPFRRTMSHPWPIPSENTSESDQASLSPRTALLSPPPFDDIDERERIPRGPGVRFRRERERAHSTASSRDLLEMLVNEEYESKQTRKILYTAFDRLEQETKRAEAAEVRIDETIQRARAINEARITALQQAARAQEELKLYKLQLDNAQKEILRAQDVLKAIEAQRDEAEAAAVSARSKARRLNEERLIELAREEGRRLGFEEGVRRGRRIGHREVYETGIDDRRDDMRQVADAVVDRLLEDRDEPEQIEVLGEPTPIPPPSISRNTPEVHRIETSINSSLEQRHSSRSRRDSSSTLRRAPDPVILPTVVEPRFIPAGIPSIPTIPSQSSRPQSVSQPWAGPPTDPPFSRPPSARNSPPSARHSGFHVPPDGFIPTADANHNISLPPPHELHRNNPSPTPSQRTLGPTSERGKSRDYMYDNYPPPRRASPDDSLASGKQSAASSISQLDIVGLPASARHRDRSQGLSVIHEDASMRSERMSDYSQTIASTSQAGRNPFPDMGSSETTRRDRKANQRLADELRYSNPSVPEEWRRQSDSSRPQQPHDGRSRHLPSHITVPTPLSPPRVLQQPDSRHRRTASERQGRPETRSQPRDQRRPLSSDSSVPEINVEPPGRHLMLHREDVETFLSVAC
ncbi:hypothetical protein OG21DRAFT_854631 [Imleria badia]|nr:hypothetical protein OG21DRAFT_854631 [Imleria badia]